MLEIGRGKGNFMKISGEQIVEAFEQIKLIGDPSLREKVVCVWQKVLESSDWKSIFDIPFHPEIDARNEDGSLVRHVILVTEYSYGVAKKNNEIEPVKVNLDHVLAGALLHDVSKVAEYSSKGAKTEWGAHVTHGIYGICISEAEGIPLEVIHIIASHTNKLNMPAKTREAIIVHQCDYLAADSTNLAYGRVTEK